jgi:hypothetical protein
MPTSSEHVGRVPHSLNVRARMNARPVRIGVRAVFFVVASTFAASTVAIPAAEGMGTASGQVAVSKAVNASRAAIPLGSRITVTSLEPVDKIRTKMVLTVKDRVTAESATTSQGSASSQGQSSLAKSAAIYSLGDTYRKVDDILSTSDAARLRELLPNVAWVRDEGGMPVGYLDRHHLDLLTAYGAGERWRKSVTGSTTTVQFDVRGDRLSNGAAKWFGEKGSGKGEAKVLIDARGRLTRYTLTAPRGRGGSLDVTFEYRKFTVSPPTTSITKKTLQEALTADLATTGSWSVVMELSSRCTGALIRLRSIEDTHADGSQLSPELIAEIGEVLTKAVGVCSTEELLELQRRELTGYLSGAQRK